MRAVVQSVDFSAAFGGARTNEGVHRFSFAGGGVVPPAAAASIITFSAAGVLLVYGQGG